MRDAAFAIPGDIRTLTGGYIYERRLLEGLRAQGRDVDHLVLPDSWPYPDPDDMAQSIEMLVAVDEKRPLILDGFVSGALDPRGMARIRAAKVAMVHHPLALESGLTEEKQAHLFRTEHANLGLVDHVLVPSPHTRDLLIQRYDVAPDRITIARPGIDRPSGRSRPISPPLILSVGIQHPRKGHDVLIAALDRLRHLDWTCVIVGAAWDAAHADALTRQVSETGLCNRLRLAGRIEQEELQTFYRQASIFALATRFEGYGIVFDEALSYGLPIVSCRTGAVPDTVPEDAGTLVPPDDPVAFADAVSELLENPAKLGQMADAARRGGMALADWSDTARIAGRVLDTIG